jgi:hypothetical protein
LLVSADCESVTTLVKEAVFLPASASFYTYAFRTAHVETNCIISVNPLTAK